jgi:hypothetical protein
MKTLRPRNRNRAIASAPKKPITMLISTADRVISTLLRRSSRKIGSLITSRKPRRLGCAGQNFGVRELMSELVLKAVISIQ